MKIYCKIKETPKYVTQINIFLVEILKKCFKILCVFCYSDFKTIYFPFNLFVKN